jgi:hypothetical protein
MNSVDNAKAKLVIEKTIFLHAVQTVRQNLGWFMSNGCISNEAALELDQVFERAVKDFLPHMNTTVEALGIF